MTISRYILVTPDGIVFMAEDYSVVYTHHIFFLHSPVDEWASQAGLVVKNPPASGGDVRDVGSVPGLGTSFGGGHGNPLHGEWECSCLQNPADKEPGELQSIQSERVGHAGSDLHSTASSLSTHLLMGT